MNTNSIVQGILDHIWEHTDVTTPDECWLWRAGTLDDIGLYPTMSLYGKVYRVARVVYELTRRGPVPGRCTVGHRCKNSLCVNPEHLQLVHRGEANDEEKQERASYQDALLFGKQVGADSAGYQQGIETSQGT